MRLLAPHKPYATKKKLAGFEKWGRHKHVNRHQPFNADSCGMSFEGDPTTW